MCGISEPSEPSWTEARFPLKFQIGDRTLRTVHLRLLRRRAHREETPLAVRDLPLAPRAAGPEVEGYLVMSHPVAAELPVFMRRGNRLRYVSRQYKRYSIDLVGGYPAYLERFSGKTRSTLRRKIKKFAERSGGEIDWRVYREPSELLVFHQLARDVSRRTYQELLFGAGLPEGEEFVARMCSLASQDEVRGYILFCDGRPVSYLYCPGESGVLYYQHLGFDAEYAQYSPGTVLQCLALEDLFREHRFKIFDFTEGEGEHKRFFSTASMLCADVFVVDHRLWNGALLFTHYATNVASLHAGRLADRLGLKARFRRAVRGTSQ
jgi:CelD/BcsL family acetyltransferase involved in cellulose biosynthesis